MFFLDLNPSTQKNKDDSNPNFLNDFKGLHTEPNAYIVVVDYSSVVSLLNPPNPYSAIVVADLLKPLVDYSVVVCRVTEQGHGEVLKGPELSNDFNDLDHATEPFNGGGMVQEPWLTVNIL